MVSVVNDSKIKLGCYIFLVLFFKFQNTFRASQSLVKAGFDAEKVS